MFKLFVGIFLILPVMASAANDTLYLPLKDTVSFQKDTVFWIVVIPKNNFISFRGGELQVDLASPKGTATLRDSTYRILEFKDAANTRNKTEVIINLYALMNRFYAEMAAAAKTTTNGKATSENIDMIKKFGSHWRLVKTREK